MFKLGRSRAVASALNASKLQFAAPAARFPGIQQRRALSIHEYLSADLLRQ
ncbi:succinyl ligase, partial [Fusarium circinatum]